MLPVRPKVANSLQMQMALAVRLTLRKRIAGWTKLAAEVMMIRTWLWTRMKMRTRRTMERVGRAADEATRGVDDWLR